MSTYNDNMKVYDKARGRPLNLKSTRASKEDEDAHRDMDGFDVDEELARLRRAIKEAETVTPGDNPALYRFIAEAFANIDEHLIRLGSTPHGWLGLYELINDLKERRTINEKRPLRERVRAAVEGKKI